MSKPTNPDLFDHFRRFEGAEVFTRVTLRDLFAGLALGGLMQGTVLDDLQSQYPDFTRASRFCYAVADAMLAEREKSEEPTP